MYWYGGAPGDWVIDIVTAGGSPNLVQLVPGAIGQCWTQELGGEPIVDLRDADGQGVMHVTARGEGAPGHWPRFQAPDKRLWMSANGGPRVLMLTTDLPEIVDQAVAAAQEAAASSAASARSAADLAASSSVAGHVRDSDPHPAYLTQARGDVRYLVAKPGTIEPLATPREVITFASTPAAEAEDMRQVWVTHGGVTRKVSWSNERGYYRGEQVPGSLYDSPATLITNYQGTGRALLVQRRGADNVRRDAGGIDAMGRVVVSDQPWEPLSIDPARTGRYTASTAPGPAPVSVRLESDDVARMHGRVVATSVMSGDILATIPAGYQPRAARLVVAATTAGSLPIELAASGAIIARAAVGGATQVSLDDITYSRVVAEQDAGGWGVTLAASAAPGTTSPMAVPAVGVTGRLYVLILARSSATDAFTTVTSAGGTWTRDTYAPSAGSVGRRIEVWHLIPSSNFSAVSIAFTGVGTAYASLYEITGHHPDTPIGQAVSDFRASSASPPPLQITPTGSGRLAIAAIAASPNQTAAVAPSAGWLTLPLGAAAGPSVAMMADPPLSPIGVSWTLGAAAGTGHAIFTIRPA